MKTIDEDIKSGQFKKIYLLYGDEAYLKKQYKDKLKKALVQPDDTMNFTAYEGKDTNPISSEQNSPDFRNAPAAPRCAESLPPCCALTALFRSGRICPEP